MIGTDANSVAPTVTCTPASGTVQAAVNAPTTITCSALDNAGNSATPAVSFTVTPKDKTPPVLEQPANVEVPAVTGNVGRIIYTKPTANDYIGEENVGSTDVTVTCAPASDTQTKALDTVTTISCSAQDKALNQAGPVTFEVRINCWASAVAMMGARGSQCLLPH